MSERRYKFHPLAEKYPLMEGLPFEELVADIREHGLREKIVLYQGLILDGRNRYLACLEAVVEPEFVEYSGDDPAGFVESANEHRRHLSPEQQQYAREQRISRVAELRRQGKTQRQIADKVGISQTQVASDLRDAVEQGCSTEPSGGKVKGKDSKSYPAKKHSGAETRDKAAQRIANQQKSAPPVNREPGDDTEHEAEAAKAEKVAGKNGRITFDWRAYDSHFGPVARGPDDLAWAYPGEKDGAEHKECIRLLSDYAKVWTAWRERLTGAKR